MKIIIENLWHSFTSPLLIWNGRHMQNTHIQIHIHTHIIIFIDFVWFGDICIPWISKIGISHYLHIFYTVNNRLMHKWQNVQLTLLMYNQSIRFIYGNEHVMHFFLYHVLWMKKKINSSALCVCLFLQWKTGAITLLLNIQTIDSGREIPSKIEINQML